MDENEQKPYPIEDTDRGWDYRYGGVVGVEAAEGIGKRLHAARLAAGIVKAVDAAKIIGLRSGSYRHAEHGIRPTHDALVKAASALYGVTDEFLRTGEPTSERDRLAERLVAVLTPAVMTPEDIENEADLGILEGRPELAMEQEAEWRDRLREMRVQEGHASSAAASAAHGWNRYTYWQHETGTRGITRDRMIAYALTMGFRPEWAVMGEGEMREPEPVEWQEQGRDLLRRRTAEPESGPGPR